MIRIIVGVLTVIVLLPVLIPAYWGGMTYRSGSDSPEYLIIFGLAFINSLAIWGLAYLAFMN